MTGCNPRHEHVSVTDFASQTFIPVEILEKIVASLLDEQDAYGSVASLSLVSYRVRLITLRRYYAKLSVRSHGHWKASCGITGIFTWVSHLKSLTSSLRHNMGDLAKFTSLKTLELDFASDGLSTQNSRCLLLFKNLVAELTRLKLTSLPRVDTTLLSLLASRFPFLIRLELSCTERLDDECCWLCYEESCSCVVHSPIPESFPSAQALVIAFANTLKPLVRLEHIFLGVFLSDADALYRHLDRCAGTIMISSPRTGFCGATPPFRPDQCPLCQEEHTVVVRERERFASALMGKMLPSLKTVGWSTYFAQGGDTNVQRMQDAPLFLIVEVRS